MLNPTRPWIVPVGGFLGAGKTTLIHAAARMLDARGLRSAVILNDQGRDLVDTAYTKNRGLAADEVVGGCFCCRFSELISVADRLLEFAPDVIFIEPVGSCTDVVATVLRPLQQNYLDSYRVAPLTVLVDPHQARKDPSVTYLFDHQIAEADIVVLNKCDLHADALPWSGPEVRRLSALTGTGVAAWLDEVLSGEMASGAKCLQIDYGEYAAAEAALAWLNWSAAVESNPALSAAQIVGPLVDELQAAITKASGTLAHLKVFAQTEGSYLKIALTSNEGEPVVEGDLTASPSPCHSLRVNVRAVLAETELERIFRQALKSLPAVWSVEHFQCFSPAPPRQP